MSTDTQLIRSEPHGEAGAVIERDAEHLVEIWCRRALAEHPAAKRVHFDVLRDHLPGFLRAMGRALAQSGSPRVDEHHDRAVQHGGERWHSGWSLTELVRDYQLLQLVILEHLEGALRRPLLCREMMAVGVFIDDAVAASIERYAAHRDEELSAAERKRAASLEEISRRKDEFMAVLAHELRNPLAPIRTALAILQTVLPSPPAPAQTALDVIDRQSRLMVRLVEDVLDIARMGQGRLELRKMRIDLTAVLDQAVQTSEPVLTGRAHQLTIALPGKPVHVEADAQRLTQVVCNLLNNAAKYTEPGGRIWLTGAREGDSAVIRVRDNGIGIPPDMVARIFDLFVQVDDSRELAQGGMGIGLTLVQRLVAQHGGTVACRSEGRGKGSEFTVRLPVADAAGVDGTRAGPGAGRTEPCALRIVEHGPKKTLSD